MAQGVRGVIATAAALTARGRRLIAAARGDVVEPGNQLDALLDAVRVLDDASIPHALIGGLAVGLRAEVPRATLDVDLAAHSTADRRSVVTALTSVGFELTGEYAHSLNFRHSSGEPVQVAFDPEFDAAIERADAITIDDTVLSVVQTADLIDMKQRAADDPARRRSKALQDLADIELLRGDVASDDEGW